jgi:hypothetical protein
VTQEKSKARQKERNKRSTVCSPFGDTTVKGNGSVLTAPCRYARSTAMTTPTDMMRCSTEQVDTVSMDDGEMTSDGDGRLDDDGGDARPPVNEPS